jgi:hypothetical protein
MSDGDGRKPNTRGLLVAIAAVVILLIGALILIRELRSSARLQDCLLSGRTNCAPIQP